MTEEKRISPAVVIVGAGLALGGGAALLYALTVRAAPEFEVSDLVISPEVVGVGQSVAISVLVINVGTETGSKTIICEVEGPIMEQTVTLEPGESRVVSFEVTPEVAKAYSVSVDGLYGSFEATEEEVAVFSVVLGVSPLTPKVGDMITWWALIENIGTVEGTPTVSWYRNNILIASSTIPSIGPGTSRLIYGSSFSLAIPGDHVLAVVVNGASDSVTITVQEAAVADIKVENLVISPTDPMVGETVYISVTVTNYGTATGSKTIVCTVS